MEGELFGKMLDMVIMLKHVHWKFHAYSAADLNRLIRAKIAAEAKGNGGPGDLRALFDLEEAIAGIRLAFGEAGAGAD